MEDERERLSETIDQLTANVAEVEDLVDALHEFHYSFYELTQKASTTLSNMLYDLEALETRLEEIENKRSDDGE